MKRRTPLSECIPIKKSELRYTFSVPLVPPFPLRPASFFFSRYLAHPRPPRPRGHRPLLLLAFAFRRGKKGAGKRVGENTRCLGLFFSPAITSPFFPRKIKKQRAKSLAFFRTLLRFLARPPRSVRADGLKSKRKALYSSSYPFLGRSPAEAGQETLRCSPFRSLSFLVISIPKKPRVLRLELKFNTAYSTPRPLERVTLKKLKFTYYFLKIISK